MSARLDGKPMAGMAIQLATGANALSASRDVRAKMAELSQGFPAGIEWAVPFDTTECIEVSLTAVAKTRGEAMSLVFLVMYLFLQKCGATNIQQHATI